MLPPLPALPSIGPTLQLAQAIDVGAVSALLSPSTVLEPTLQLAQGFDTLQLAQGFDVNVLLSPETALAPLNPDTEPWVRSLVWTDFRVAVSLFVAAPLALLFWSVFACRPRALGGDDDVPRSSVPEATLRYMTSYWQASCPPTRSRAAGQLSCSRGSRRARCAVSTTTRSG